MEWNPSLHLGVVSTEKWALGSSLTKVANFTYYKLKRILLEYITRVATTQIEFNIQPLLNT